MATNIKKSEMVASPLGVCFSEHSSWRVGIDVMEEGEDTHISQVSRILSWTAFQVAKHDRPGGGEKESEGIVVGS